MEVVTAKLDENRTIVTEADTNLLQKHRRRTRRSTENVDLVNFQPERIDHKVEKASIHQPVLKE